MHRVIRAGLVAAAAAASLVSVAGQEPPPSSIVAIHASDATALRQWEGWIRAREEDGALRVRERAADVMLPGREHERLEQYHRGVRIFGAGVTRQWKDGRLETVFGRVYDALTLDVEPSISAARVGERAGCARLLGAPELTIFSGVDARPALTWRLRCYRPGDLAEVFVNAHTGQVEGRVSNFQTQGAVGDGRGVYFDRKKMSVSRQGSGFAASDALRPPQLLTLDLQGNLPRAKALLLNEETLRPSDTASDGDNVWEDGAVVDAHAYIGWTYDYLFKRFNRRGLDDHNTPLLTIVHPVTQEGALSLDPEDFGTFAVNAFWCGPCGPTGRGMMVFGDGIPSDYIISTGQRVSYLAASLDITAHELAHGVTDHSSGLIYQGESGALNEAFSDMIGTSVEFYFQPVGAAIGQADYRMGEDSFISAAERSIDGIRSMAVPTAYGDPDHYSERYRGTQDDGGVHTNSGIPNHVFYLAIEGGTHRLSGITVPGVGPQNRVQIERAFFRAFTLFLPPNATFALAREATMRAARELYGAGSAAERAISTAWSAVGVQ